MGGSISNKEEGGEVKVEEEGEEELFIYLL